MTDCKALQDEGGWWEDRILQRCTFPIGPRNTISNLAYILAGLLALFLCHTTAAYVFALLASLLGIGSGLYHGTKEQWAAKLDDAGMYAVFTGLLVYVLNPAYPYIAPLMLVLAALVTWRLGFGPRAGAFLDPFVGFGTAVIVVKLAISFATAHALIGLGLFGIAYEIWWMDKQWTFWFPKWGHAIWHVLTAAGLLVLFLGAR